MSEQVKRYTFGDLMGEAVAIVRQKFVFKRFIDGTPLSNDVPVWMTEFALDKLAQRCRELESQHGSARMVLDLQISMLRDERDAIEGERDALRATLTAARDKLGPAVRNGHPALTELAASEALALLDAACADIARGG